MSFDKFSFTVTYDENDAVMARNCKASTSNSVGYDLCSNDNYRFCRTDVICVDTGICVNIPKGCYGRIAERSSIALKYGVIIGGGVIDPDYKGVLKVILINTWPSSDPLIIRRGDRIAQLIIEKCLMPEFKSEISRGDGGFGSTGI